MAKAENNKKQPRKQKSSTTKKVKKQRLPNRPKYKLQELIAQVNEQDGLKRSITTLQESVNSYVLLGYSFNGTPITAIAATTPQEYDALYQRVQTFLHQRPPAAMLQQLDSPPPKE